MRGVRPLSVAVRLAACMGTDCARCAAEWRARHLSLRMQAISVVGRDERLESVLWAKRIPYTPSVDFSLPAVNNSDLSKLATTLLLIEHETLSPFTVIAISWVTG